jgi:ABC-type phosphate/phosphonate transport system substrate-binding protein
MNKPFILGAVAYAPKVVTIWEGFKAYFEKQGLKMDYVLFSNYETQVEALMKGEIDVAWNSPLAWLRADRLGKAMGKKIEIGPMRDTDQNLTSVLVVKSSSPFQKISDLKGKTIGMGAIDSPQARLIPLEHMRSSGLMEFKPRLFDVLGGKHGDHIGGEREAALALMSGEVDAAWMIDGNFQAFSQEGTLPVGEARLLTHTAPYDHCIFSFKPDVSGEDSKRFSDILLGMKWSDAEIRPLLELEGLKEWKVGRTSGFSLLSSAVDHARFYDDKGMIIETNYRY